MLGDGGLSKAVDEVVTEVITEAGFKERLKKLVVESVEKELPAAVDRIVKERVDDHVRNSFYRDREHPELKDAIQKAIKEYASLNEDKIRAMVEAKAEKVMEDERIVAEACSGHLSKLLRDMAEKAVADAARKKKR